MVNVVVNVNVDRTSKKMEEMGDTGGGDGEMDKEGVDSLVIDGFSIGDAFDEPPTINDRCPDRSCSSCSNTKSRSRNLSRSSFHGEFYIEIDSRFY